MNTLFILTSLIIKVPITIAADDNFDFSENTSLDISLMIHMKSQDFFFSLTK